MSFYLFYFYFIYLFKVNYTYLYYIYTVFWFYFVILKSIIFVNKNFFFLLYLFWKSLEIILKIKTLLIC